MMLLLFKAYLGKDFPVLICNLCTLVFCMSLEAAKAGMGPFGGHQKHRIVSIALSRFLINQERYAIL